MKIIYRYKNRFTSIAIVSLFFLVCFISACNENPTKVDDKTMSIEENDTPVESSIELDNSFIATAAKNNLEQIQLGQLAQLKGNMQQVKDLGMQIVKDNVFILKELQIIAGKKQITLPATLSAEAQAFYSNIVNKEGTDFDKEYINKIVEDNKADIKKYKYIARGAVDKDISHWVNLKLPILKMHLDSAFAYQAILLEN